MRIKALIFSLALVAVVCCGKEASKQEEKQEEKKEQKEEEKKEEEEEPKKDPVFPILMLKVPETVSNTGSLDIEGLGFDDTHKIFLQTLSADSTRLELSSKLTSTGISCTIPDDIKEGSYGVKLYVPTDDIYWTLSKSLTITVIMRLSAVRYIDEVKYDFDAAPADVLADTAANRNMTVDEFKSWLQSAGYVNTSGTSGYGIKYDEDGRIVKYTSLSDDTDAYSISWSSDGAVATFGNKKYEDGYDMVRCYEFTVEGGRVVSMMESTENRDSFYDLIYDDYGNVTKQQKDTGREYNTFKFNSFHCFTGIGKQVYFTYDDNAEEVNSSNIDVPIAILDCIYHYGFSGLDADWLPLLNMAGLSGKCSPKLPAKVFDAMTRKYFDISYDIDANGYARKAGWKTEGKDQMFDLIPVTSSTSVEFVYN